MKKLGVQGFLAKPPRGVGFLFQFSDEARKKKKPTSPGVFPNSVNLLGKIKFLGWFFFSVKLQFFGATTKKNTPPGGFARKSCSLGQKISKNSHNLYNRK